MQQINMHRQGAFGCAINEVRLMAERAGGDRRSSVPFFTLTNLDFASEPTIDGWRSPLVSTTSTCRKYAIRW